MCIGIAGPHQRMRHGPERLNAGPPSGRHPDDAWGTLPNAPLSPSLPSFSQVNNLVHNVPGAPAHLEWLLQWAQSAWPDTQVGGWQGGCVGGACDGWFGRWVVLLLQWAFVLLQVWPDTQVGGYIRGWVGGALKHLQASAARHRTALHGMLRQPMSACAGGSSECTLVPKFCPTDRAHEAASQRQSGCVAHQCCI